QMTEVAVLVVGHDVPDRAAGPAATGAGPVGVAEGGMGRREGKVADESRNDEWANSCHALPPGNHGRGDRARLCLTRDGPRVPIQIDLDDRQGSLQIPNRGVAEPCRLPFRASRRIGTRFVELDLALTCPGLDENPDVVLVEPGLPSQDENSN